LLWCGGATLIAASRVNLRRHRVRDVIGGAVVGILTSQLELRSERGLLFRPFIHREGQMRTTGLQLSRSF
jgi:hypothetical protein